MTAAVSKPSALETLRALSQKKAAPAAPTLAAQSQDPALAGAKLVKNTVHLGIDPTFAAIAMQAAQLDAALKRAEAEFKTVQAEVRDYGRGKRELYNDAFKTNVTTVCVPYEVQTPTGLERKVVQVICTNKYSVQQDMVLGNREKFGDKYDRLFEEERTKKLKPNAEELIRGIFQEVGLQGDELEEAMSNLFEEVVKVSTTENYEQESKKVQDPLLQAVLEQAVTRSQPALKFG